MAHSDGLSGCTYCGTNPYIGCKHRSPVERPTTWDGEPPEEKVDLRKFSKGQGRAFAAHRAKRRREARNGE